MTQTKSKSSSKCEKCGKTFKSEDFASAESQLAQHNGIVHAVYSGGLREKQS